MPGFLTTGLVMLVIAGSWLRWTKRHPANSDDTDKLGIGTFAACGLALVVLPFVAPTILM